MIKNHFCFESWFNQK